MAQAHAPPPIPGAGGESDEVIGMSRGSSRVGRRATRLVDLDLDRDHEEGQRVDDDSGGVEEAERMQMEVPKELLERMEMERREAVSDPFTSFDPCVRFASDPVFLPVHATDTNLVTYRKKLLKPWNKSSKKDLR
jgi:hypothetical protein